MKKKKNQNKDKRNYNDFDLEKKSVPINKIKKKKKDKNKLEKDYNNFQNEEEDENEIKIDISNEQINKTENNFNFDKSIISKCDTGNMNLEYSPSLFSILEKYKTNPILISEDDKDLNNEENLSNESHKNLQISEIEQSKPFFSFDKNTISPCVIENIIFYSEPEIFKILEKYKTNPILISEDDKDLNNEENLSNESHKNLQISEIEQSKPFFSFDTNTISPCVIENIIFNLEPEIFKILEKYKNKKDSITKNDSNNSLKEINIQEPPKILVKEEHIELEKEDLDLVQNNNSSIPVKLNSEISPKSELKEDLISDKVEKNNIIIDNNDKESSLKKEKIEDKSNSYKDIDTNNDLIKITIQKSNEKNYNNFENENIHDISNDDIKNNNTSNNYKYNNFENLNNSEKINKKNTTENENSKKKKKEKEIKKKKLEKIIINSTPLIHQKISNIKKKKIDNLKQSIWEIYEEKYILPIDRGTPINKINIDNNNFDEIKKLISNKSIYFFTKNDYMICQKPIINTFKDKDKYFNNITNIFDIKQNMFEKIFFPDKIYAKKLDLDGYLGNFSLCSNILSIYDKKNIKSIDLGKNDKEKKVNFLIDEEEENDSIILNNEKRIKKLTLSKRLEKPIIDNKKIKFSFNTLHMPFLDNINNFYEENNIKSVSIQNNIIIKKLNIEENLENISTEIYYTFKHDNIISNKINLCTDIFTENSIEEINMNYSKKYLININISNNYSKKENIDIFDDIDIDINHNYILFKKKKNKKIKNLNKFLKSGKASTSLLYNSSFLSNENMDFNHRYTYIKNNIKKSNNYNNNEYLKNSTKIKNESNLISNKTHKDKDNNNGKIIHKNNSEILNSNNNMNNLDIMRNEYYEKKKKKESEFLLKKIKKINDEINRYNKKLYLTNLKNRQNYKIEQEVKNEKKFKLLFLTFFGVAPLLYSYYQKFTGN